MNHSRTAFVLMMGWLLTFGTFLRVKAEGVFSPRYEFLGNAPEFNQTTAQGIPEKSNDEIAEAIAARKFRAKYAVCGMTKLKERRSNVWTYSTFVGYGGGPGDDILVILPQDKIEQEVHDAIGEWIPIRLAPR